MKHICAWCDKLLRYTCPKCGHELTPNQDGSYRCDAGETTIQFTPEALAKMPTSHGICVPCAQKQCQRKPAIPLTDEDRANLVALVTPAPTKLPTAADLVHPEEGRDAVEAERQIKERTRCP